MYTGKTYITILIVFLISSFSYQSIAQSLPDSTKTLSKKELQLIRKDSIITAEKKARAIKDSIRRITPRIMRSYSIPDSLHYKRILLMNMDTYKGELTYAPIDTTYNEWYTEYPYFKRDVNATYLGVVGSPMQYYNFFERRHVEEFEPMTPYMEYTNDPSDQPIYNVKSPYTELGYWGTLLSSKDKEESSMRFLHTQNITPKWNICFLYKQYGGKGQLVNERSNSKSIAITTNYLGEQYNLHAGYIGYSAIRTENGGIQKASEVLDTLMDAKIIAVNLGDASNTTKKHQFYINQSYRMRLDLSKFGIGKTTESLEDTSTINIVPIVDSTGVMTSSSNDTIVKPIQDTLAIERDGTTVFFGHYGEYAKYSKAYTDNIALTDDVGRSFYNNKFYINPTSSNDSLSLIKIENKFYIKLQPWSVDAMVSTVTGGIDIENMWYYSFNPSMYISGTNNTYLSNSYVYAAADGRFRKYIKWNALGKYGFTGYHQNDVIFKGDICFSMYPFKNKKEPINLYASLETSNKRPDYLSNNLYTNHLKWSNDFAKVSTSRITGKLDIPKWKISAFFGYSLINSYIYHDTEGMIRQNSNVINVMSAYLQKNFELGCLHLNNQLLFQASNNQDILPLPKLSAHMRYFLEFNVKKDVMRMQIGADMTYNTKYYAPAYNPESAAFTLQNKLEIGNTPYIDAFINVQWKRACIFIKYTNVALGWPTSDYFSAYNYIKPKNGLKVGIYWPFYYR
ncbi:MAG: putative porin [Bacteroidales bacterium]